MSGLTLVAGEENLSSASLRPSLVTPWLSTDVAVTNRRFLAKMPNTILGLFPVGSKDVSVPVGNVASVGVDVKVQGGNLFITLGLLFIGFMFWEVSVIAAVCIFLLAVAAAVTVLRVALTVENSGGGVITIPVSILDKAKLEAYRDQVNERIFAPSI